MGTLIYGVRIMWGLILVLWIVSFLMVLAHSGISLDVTNTTGLEWPFWPWLVTWCGCLYYFCNLLWG